MKKYNVEVTYTITCSKNIEVEADDIDDAAIQARQIISDTNMVEYMDDGRITDLDVTEVN